MLERAAMSIARQTYPNYTWVVVNDGGDEAAARAVLDASEVDPHRIKFLSNPSSAGMEAASNLGIRASASDYIVIHDDDDTLHPEFLEATVGFLESKSGRSYGGVATGVEYVSEEIRGDQIIVHDRRPYMNWVQSVDLSEMFAQNMITSNSFLYRRSIFNKIGGYNEDLPVLGDWFFNIEFLLQGDIKILDRTLCYYHHRDHGELNGAEPYANSVIGGLDQHRENAARCRNALIRKYRRDAGVAAGIVAGYFAHAQRHPDARGGTANGQYNFRREGLVQDLIEQDRLWVLAHLLAHRAASSWFSGRKPLTVERGASLADLARLAKDRRVKFSPPPGFDEERYLATYPDVAAEIGKDGFRSGYEHYALSGHLEGRDRPTVKVD